MATWDRYKNTTSSMEIQVRLGSVFYPRAFCDDPLGGVYLTKNPNCKLKMTPIVQFINTDVAWDISESNSASGTIDTFDITWGGVTNIGNLAAQDWAADPQTGNVQYTTKGIYTVQAYVTDTLSNRSKVQKLEIRIIEPDDFIALDRLYIGTTDGGMYYLEPDGSPTAANSGLIGNHANFRSMKLHPAYKDLPSSQHHLWACTQDGIAYTMNGGTSWMVISEADLGTPGGAGGEASADLDNIDLDFDPTDPNHIIVLRTTATDSWVYESSDYGATWSNNKVSV